MAVRDALGDIDKARHVLLQLAEWPHPSPRQDLGVRRRHRDRSGDPATGKRRQKCGPARGIAFSGSGPRRSACEHEFYAEPENQEPQGRPRRRKRSNLTEMVPVRFPPETLEEVRRLAEADDRSVSSWIRRAVEHELEQQAG
jgi:hypothetical protein